MNSDKPQMSEKEFIELRQKMQENLMQLCAQDVQNILHHSRGDPGNILLDLRIKLEQLTIDVHAMITALISLKIVEPQALAITSFRLMEQRISQLREAQSKIIIARGKPQ